MADLVPSSINGKVLVISSEESPVGCESQQHQDCCPRSAPSVDRIHQNGVISGADAFKSLNSVIDPLVAFGSKMHYPSDCFSSRFPMDQCNIRTNSQIEFRLKDTPSAVNINTGSTGYSNNNNKSASNTLGSKESKHRQSLYLTKKEFHQLNDYAESLSRSLVEECVLLSSTLAWNIKCSGQCLREQCRLDYYQSLVKAGCYSSLSTCSYSDRKEGVGSTTLSSGGSPGLCWTPELPSYATSNEQKEEQVDPFVDKAPRVKVIEKKSSNSFHRFSKDISTNTSPATCTVIHENVVSHFRCKSSNRVYSKSLEHIPNAVLSVKNDTWPRKGMKSCDFTYHDISTENRNRSSTKRMRDDGVKPKVTKSKLRHKSSTKHAKSSSIWSRHKKSKQRGSDPHDIYSQPIDSIGNEPTIVQPKPIIGMRRQGNLRKKVGGSTLSSDVRTKKAVNEIMSERSAKHKRFTFSRQEEEVKTCQKVRSHVDGKQSVASEPIRGKKSFHGSDFTVHSDDNENEPRTSRRDKHESGILAKIFPISGLKSCKRKNRSSDCMKSSSSPSANKVRSSSKPGVFGNIRSSFLSLFHFSGSCERTTETVCPNSGIEDSNSFELASDSSCETVDNLAEGFRCTPNTLTCGAHSDPPPVPPPRGPPFLLHEAVLNHSHYSAFRRAVTEAPRPTASALVSQDSSKETPEAASCLAPSSAESFRSPVTLIFVRDNDGAHEGQNSSTLWSKEADGDASKLDEGHHFASIIEKVKEYCWYWGPISSDAALKVVENEPNGSFIVRDSADDHYIFSLTFKQKGEVRHVRIEHDQGNFSFHGSSSATKFKSQTIVEFIQSAVEHSRSGRYLFFMHRKPVLGPMRVQLLHPVSRSKSVSSLQHLCRYFIVRKVRRRDHLQYLPVPPFIQKYLSSPYYYSELVENYMEEESSQETDLRDFAFNEPMQNFSETSIKQKPTLGFPKMKTGDASGSLGLPKMKTGGSSDSLGLPKMKTGDSSGTLGFPKMKTGDASGTLGLPKMKTGGSSDSLGLPKMKTGGSSDSLGFPKMKTDDLSGGLGLPKMKTGDSSGKESESRKFRSSLGIDSKEGNSLATKHKSVNLSEMVNNECSSNLVVASTSFNGSSVSPNNKKSKCLMLDYSEKFNDKSETADFS